MHALVPPLGGGPSSKPSHSHPRLCTKHSRVRSRGGRHRAPTAQSVIAVDDVASSAGTVMRTPAAWLVLLVLAMMARAAEGGPVADPICRLVAGGMASAVAKSALAPFERIKLLLQTSTKFDGPFDALRRVHAEEGFASLWKGNVANLARIVPTYALRFALLDHFRAVVAAGGEAGKPLSLGRELCAGAMTGAAVCLFSHPLDLARTHIAVSSQSSKGIIVTLRGMIAAQGLWGVYRGLLMSVMEIAPYTAISLGGFEYLKHALNPEGGPISTRTRLGASWFSGLCASLMCYPLDSVKRRLMVDGTLGKGNCKYRGSIVACVSSIIREEGVRSLYRGCMLNALKSAPTFALTATMNDAGKKWLGCG